MPSDPLRWKALAVVCAAFFMTILDVSIVNVALPSIGTALHFSDVQWVLTAYGITFGGFLLLAGRLADLLGRRRVFVFGVVLFTVASLLCGVAWSEGVLIAARAIQGLGAAVIVPSALSIVTTTFQEGAERNKALGIWGALGGGGAAVGVLLGGILTTYLSWRWIFIINVPVGAVALLFTPRFVRESRAERETSQDIGGAAAVTAGVALVVYATAKAPVVGWGSGRTIGVLAAAAVLLVAFVLNEARHKDPLMPFRIFRIHTVAGANVASLLLGAIIYANFFLLTLYVQNVLHFSAVRTGLTFVATAGTAVIWAGIAQAVTTRFGVKPVILIGFVAMTAGMVWYTQISATGSFASTLLPGYLIVGFAIPFTFIPMSIAALAGVDRDEAGLASGLMNSGQQVGGAIGVAVCFSVLLSHPNLFDATGQIVPASYTSGAAWGFWVLAALTVVAFVGALLLIQPQELQHTEATAVT